MSDEIENTAPMVIGDVIDRQKWRAVLEREEPRRKECDAGLRPWKIAPGTDPRSPEGLAGMTPGEKEQLANAGGAESFSSPRSRAVAQDGHSEWRLVA